MAIYDWNGTTSTKNKKAYDWNGTASTQLRKGYDWDGTASHLIYSAEEQLIGTGGIISGFTLTTGTYSYRGTTKPALGGTATTGITLKVHSNGTGNGYGAGNAYSKNKVDLTSFDKCAVVLNSDTTSTDQIVQIGFISAIASDTSYGSDGWKGMGSNAHIFDCEAFILLNSVNPAGTHEFDISSLSGEYYLTVSYVNKTSSSGNSKTLTVASVKID